MLGKRLPKQVLPFDGNEGAGFWWANSLNTFTRNVACENDRYGFRFEATPAQLAEADAAHSAARRHAQAGRHPHAAVRPLRRQRSRTAKGCTASTSAKASTASVRTLGIRSSSATLKIWDVHYAFRPQSPSLLVEDLTI